MIEHANSVGIVKKDIYVIKNTINDKKYVGQSIDAAYRFYCHCKKSSSKDNSLIDKAIQKYGSENFYYEILESQVENFDERESYWIKELNTMKPNGYNIMPGGNRPPRKSGSRHPNSIFSEEDIAAIKIDLSNTKLSLNQLADKYKCSKKTILRINNGTSYRQDSETYPIRKVPLQNGDLSEEDAIEIINILKTSFRNYEDICSDYGVGINAIKEINSGKSHRQDNEDYPIRKFKNSGNPRFSKKDVIEISDLIANTNLSLREIARRYNCQKTLIVNIKNGSNRYRIEGYKYPLRANN